MAQNETAASIADSAKPNAGRIYDYILGGNHNFEVDRIASKQVLKIAPYAEKLFRLVRWFLGEAVRRQAAEGYAQFIDFASGLPTVDHIHQVAPAGTKVIYSDIDPVTVAYGQEIIKDLPDVRYGVCRAEKPEELLNSPMVETLFGKRRKVVIGLNGVAYFISNDALHHTMRVLYDWAEKGSRLFMCDIGYEGTSLSPESKAAVELYAKLGQPLFIRSQTELVEINKPWKVMEPGYRPLEEWVGVNGGVAEASQGAGFNMVGAILEK